MKTLVVVLLQLLLLVSALDEVVVDIDVTNPGPSINPRFASYSYEYGGLPSVAGETPNLRSSFFQLMNNIKDYTGSSPQFRIGGNSADTSWWNPDNLPKPTGVTYNIQAPEVQTIQAVCEKLDTVATISVDFRIADNASWAVEYVKAVSSLIGWDKIYAIEIGNEVDLFGENGIRDSSYSYTQYKPEWENYLKGMQPSIPDKFIQGATYATCCSDSFLTNVQGYIDAEKAALKTLSLHDYPLTHCGSSQPTLIQLMQDSAAEGTAKRYVPYASMCKDAGIQFWMGEINSASCGGAPNVSDVFGSALWALDILFNYVSAGVIGVNFHGGDSGYYTSFAYSNPSPDAAPLVRPLYYGQYLFAQAHQSDSGLISAVIRNTTNNYIKVWAVLDNTNQEVRVVIINKDIETDTHASIKITLASQSYSDDAALITLTADSPYSQTGVKLAGQTFDGTQTGAPVGTYSSTPVTGTNGVFVVTIAPASAAMLTVKKS